MAEILAAKHRAEFGDLVKHRNTDAEAVERKLKQLSETGSQSLSALSSTLKDTRTALGKAADTAQQSFLQGATAQPC